MNLTAKFEEGEQFTVASSLYQYDKNRTLEVEGVDLPDGYTEVQFSKDEKQGESIQRMGTVSNGKLTVDVPNALTFDELRTSDYSIWAFIYVTDEQMGRTVYKILMNVIARPELTGEVPEPDTGNPFGDALQEVKKEVEKSKGYSESAKGFSEQANGDKNETERIKNEVVKVVNGFDAKVNESVESIIKAGTEQAGAVEQVGEQQTQAVNDAGSKQVQAVTEEGIKQKQELQKETELFRGDREQIEQNKNDILSLKQHHTYDKILEKIFGLRKNGKVYQTELYLFDTNPTSTGIKTLSNKDLVCEPSTDKIEGRDDYEGIGLFDWYDCNYVTNEYGRKIPTAIKGIDSDFVDDGYHDVGVLQMTPYWNVEEKNGKQIWTISDTPNKEYGLVGWEYARKEDGTFAPYIVHSKYCSSKGKDGLLRSVGNAIPERNLSHNKIITESQKKGKQCWGSATERNTFQLLFQIIKYATKNSQTLWTGCTNYNYVYPASLEYAEEYTYFPVTNEQANNLIVGSRVSVGYNNNGAYSEAHAYADSAKILKIETLDDANKAVYLDITKGFSTSKVDGKAVNLLTMHWASGSTNKVIGKHDGSFSSNTDYKHPYRIQGLEYAVGGYVIPTDVVMNFQSDYSKDIMLSKMGQAKSTSDSVILSTYTKVGNFPNIGDGRDFYIGDIGINVENCVWYPLRKGTSYANGHGDYCYSGGKTTSGTREFLVGGYLGHGTDAGSVFLYCWNGLGNSHWSHLGCD